MMTSEELAARILTYQEMYIYGRMKLIVADYKVLDGYHEIRNRDFGQYCVNRCVSEIGTLVEQVPEEELLKLLYLTTYKDFDEFLRDKDLETYYGGFDTIEFASDYNRHQEEFNSFVREYV